MKTFVFLCVIVYSFVDVSCLKCNLCVGSLESDCAKGKSAGMAIQNCILPNIPIGAPPPSVPEKEADDKNNATKLERDIYCVNIEYKGNNVTSDNVQRGCGYIYPKVNICNFITETVGNVKSCDSCDTDLCNLS